MLLPNVDDTTMDSLLSLADEYPGYCLPMIGLHPTSVDELFKQKLELLGEKLGKREFWGIGETGMDLYWNDKYLEQQVETFKWHISMAKEFQLPLVIHTRNSFHEIFKVLDHEHNDSLQGVFHAFTGNIKQARKITDYGFKIGIGGIVTFKNAGLDRIVKDIALEDIVLETDAPYLSPHPKRGKRNEPAYLIFIAQKMAEIHRQPLEVIADITTRNAAALFKIKI